MGPAQPRVPEPNLDELIPRWLFPIRHPAVRLLIALAVGALTLLPFALASNPAGLRLTPVLVAALVVVAALAGSWPAAVAGAIVTLGYWWYSIPPSHSFALDAAGSWVGLVGMVTTAAMLPVLTRTIERALGDVRRLDELRMAAAGDERDARQQAETAARAAETLAHQHTSIVALARAVAVAASLPEIADRALDHLVVPDMPTDSSIALVNGNRLRVLASRGSSPEMIAALERVRLSDSRWLRTVLSGEPAYIDDRAAFAADHPDAQVLRLYPSGSWAVIPFRHDTTIGLLSVHYLRPAALSAYAEHFAVVADVIATALERARARDALTTQLRDLEAAYAERDRIARTLSGTFVPPTLPDLPGFDATGWVEPAADGIAGDFYDLFQIAGGDWVAVLGDVAGKGAEAGAVTALARYAARASALSDPDPAAIAEIANRTLYEDSSDLFCTIGLVRYAAAEQTIDVTLAGHPQARLLYEGRVERLGHPNLALGIELTNYQTSRYPLPAGATVVLFSDGLTDRAHSFSDDDLDDFLATVESDCAAKVADNLRSLVHRLPADHPDDVAVLAVSRLR